MSASPSEVTRLIESCADGDERAYEELFSLVYDDLRAIAHRQLRGEADGHTLNTTALVHECYVDLAGQDHSRWRDRAHFFALASTAMRHVLVDYARRKAAKKRGGSRVRIPLRDDLASIDDGPTVELLALDDALSDLGDFDARMAKIVECRFFGGMTVRETAEALDVSTSTIERGWTRAKAHLYLTLATANGTDLAV